MDTSGLAGLDERIAGCRVCPRLVSWREEVARTKRAGFADWDYWVRHEVAHYEWIAGKGSGQLPAP